MNRRLGLLLAFWALVLTVSCGATPAIDSSGDPETGLPEGRWIVTTLDVDGHAIDLDQSSVRLEMLNVGSSLRVDTGCHRLFGSYTFNPDNSASFTVPGTSTNECSGTDQVVEDAFLAVIESVNSWQGDRQELSLVAPTGRLVLAPDE